MKEHQDLNVLLHPPVPQIVLGSDGYFALDGKRFFPTGFNYWPGSCGVEMWQVWPDAEIRHDFALVAATPGFNTLRVFLRWADFEKVSGVYEEKMWERLLQMLHWADAAGIYLQPSLFVGFMSGGVFWPEWKRGNVFSDGEMRKRAVAFARKAAEVMAEVPHVLAGVDLGNELCCLAESSAAAPGEVMEWCADITGAVRAVLPGVPVISGNEQNQVINDTGWRFGAQPGTDLLSMHGYPVPGWHALGFDGMTDPFAAHLLPFYTRCARAFAPVMLQEFGTIVTFGARQMEVYLRRMLPAARAAGANGYLWWCMRDFSTSCHPYNRVPMERNLGFFDAQDEMKPGMAFFQTFCQSLAASTEGVEQGVHAVLWPEQYYPRDNPKNPGNDPVKLSSRMAVTSFMLEQLTDQPTAVVRTPEQAVAAGVETVWVTGAALELLEWRGWADWARGGGRLIVLGVDPVLMTEDVCRDFGFRPVDYRAPNPVSAEVDTVRLTFEAFPRNLRMELEVDGATVLMRDETERIPICLRSEIGEGQILAFLPYLEDTVLHATGTPAVRDQLLPWYDWLA